jgi:hypothetical protein
MLEAMSELAVGVLRLLRLLANVEELEVLLVLASNCGRNWSADQVAAELRIPHPPQAALERLAHLNLVDVKLAHDVLYRFAPPNPDIERDVSELAREYEVRRLLVLDSVGRHSAIVGFAEAFRLRRR